MCLHQLKSKINDLVLLLKTVLRHGNYLLLSVCTDGNDANGLKLEKTGSFLSRCDVMSSKITTEFLWLALPGEIHLISSS